MICSFVIPDLGPDSEAANRLDTADESGPRSGLSCILYSPIRATRIGRRSGSSVVVDNIHETSRTLDLTRKRLIVWIPLTSRVRSLVYVGVALTGSSALCSPGSIF